jgi:hypothetical protein
MIRRPLRPPLPRANCEDLSTARNRNFIQTSHPIAFELSSFASFMTVSWMDVSSFGFRPWSSRIEQDLAQQSRYRHNSLPAMWFAD